MTELGEILPNPFSLGNMDSAYTILKSENPDLPDFKAKTTHLYIRFLPKNFNELDILKDDTTLVLYEYPLHYKIKKPGSFYHDPELPLDAITWQYTVMEVSYLIPPIDHEILAELCMPEIKDKNSNLKSTNQQSLFFKQLKRKAVHLVNPNKFLKSVTNDDWTPSGTLINEGIPVESIEVKIRENLFHIEKVFADWQGNFTAEENSFDNEVEYSIDYQRYHFSVLAGFGSSQASYTSNAMLTSWNPTFANQHYYPRVYSAAYHYYYKNIDGLRRPPLNSLFSNQMKIHACIGDGGNGEFYPSGSSGEIFIYASTNSYDEVFSATIHELAHSAHYDFNHSIFLNITDKRVIESWAVGVQWYLTPKIFPSYDTPFHGDYKPVVRDLVNMTYCYSISQIEVALLGQYTWNNWRDNIKALYQSPNENYVDVIFSSY